MMKTILKYRSITLVTALAFIVTACGESTEPVSQSALPDAPEVEAMPTLKLSSAALDIEAGSTFTLDVELDEFPVTEGGGINIGYSPEVLQVKEVKINAETWGFVNRQGTIDNFAGSISNVLVSSFQDVAGKAVVATITFEAIAVGSSDISLSESTINPFASAGVAIKPIFVSSHINVR